MTSTITFDNVCKSFASDGLIVSAVGPITLSIRPGEFVSLVGPSGCGKTTLLSMLAGFIEASSGSIRIDGISVGRSVPSDLGFIFQRDTVLPWYSVWDNVGLGPKFHGTPKAKRDAKIRSLLKLGRLEKFAKAFPHQLSGGMRRRLALLMSLACDPKILLLDEPFAALDAHTRTNIHQELIGIWQTQKQTIVLITHDLDEAIALSDRVIVLSNRPSRILLDEHIGIPHPRNVYTVRQNPQFGHHYKRVWAVLGEEFQNGADI